MAYSLTINSKFKPFSYDELIKPILMATQAHQAIEEQYAMLSDKASVWKNMANEQTDKETYKLYKAYADDLEAKAKQLSKEGLNMTSRQDMLNMRTRYGNEIVPIENAYKARAEEVKEQLAGRAQGIVYEGDASTSSLDRYLKDPSIKYRYANSQEGYKRVLGAASALAKELRSYGKGKKLDAYTNTWLQQHGYSSSEIGQAIADIEGAIRGDGNIRGNNVLSSILANEMQTSGVSDWNKAAQLDYYNRIAPALYQAVGQTSISPFTDQGAVLAAKPRSSNSSNDEYPTRGSLRSWEGIVTGDRDSFKDKRYQNALSIISNSKKNYDKKSMLIYEKIMEEAKRLQDEQPPTTRSGFSYTGALESQYGIPGGTNRYVSAYSKAYQDAKEKYGEENILTQDEYNLLKELGYSTDSDFTSTDIVDKINRSLQAVRPSSVNMSDVSHPASIIDEQLKRLKKVYDIDENKEIDIPEGDTKDIAYSNLYKDDLLVLKGGKRIRVPLDTYSPDLKYMVNSILNNEEYQLPGTDLVFNIPELMELDEGQAMVQDLITTMIREKFNSYDKIRGNTSSNR